jgi:outer membrane protein assembly factor BamB
MNRTVGNHRCVGALLAAAVAWACLSSDAAKGADVPTADALEMASQIVRASGAPGGVCAVVGTRDADLPAALAKQGSFVVHCLVTDAELCADMREAIRSRGVYGTVSVNTLDGGRLPYFDNLVNILVVDNYPLRVHGNKDGLSPDEVLRVLAPLGTAYVGASSTSGQSPASIEPLTTRLRSMGIENVSVVETGGTWVRFTKPWPEDIDEWTHYLHGPDGNPVARDRVVGPPRHYQWISEPMWLRSHETDSSVSTLVTARGRLFAIVDEAPISLAGQHRLPDKWFLVARDAFNGVLLWKVPIRRWGWREWKGSWFASRPADIPLNIQKRLVAVGDKVYVTLGYTAPVSELDARTGEVLKTYDGTERTGEILLSGGTLILSALTGDQLKVMAVDAASAKRLWVSEKAYGGTTVDYVKRQDDMKLNKLDPSVNMATDGRVVALVDGPQIVALDFQTGKKKWRADFPLVEADRTAGGIPAQGNLWIGTMIVRDGVVLHASPHQLAAFSADSGELLWSQPKKYIGHLWYEWKDVFVIGDLVWTWSAELDEGSFDIGRTRKQRELWPRTVNGYDLKTGDLEKAVPLGAIFKTHHHHRCYRNKATLRYILASRRGTEYVDLKQGQHTVHNWVRGTCHVGMMPANGLQYVPPHPCQCYIDEKLNGMNALAPAKEPESEKPQTEDAPPLQRGPAFGQLATPNAPLPTPADWPTFRHDAMRTGSVDTRLPDDAAPLWRVTVGRRPSPPIVVGDRLFVALVDEHHVACLDARDGTTLWQFAAGARADSPPTYHQGTVLFGCADGWVYCLRAADGQLVWRFRAAPEERLMAAFGQLESAWPVHGSVLVQDGTVYFAAGRSSQLDGGIYVYGLDAATGELLHRARLEGPDYAVDPSGKLAVRPEPGGGLHEAEGPYEENFKLPMGALPDVLMGDGSRIYMRSVTFDPELNRQSGRPSLQTPSGFLEDSYFKRMPWTFDDRGSSYARLIVHDSEAVYCIRMFDSLRGLDPTVFFTPGSQGYLLFAKNMQGERNAWAERIPMRIRAMVLAAGRLIVAGPPDVVDPKDPLGAFEGRAGGVLAIFNATSGEKLAEHRLPSPPVFNGASAARARLYLAAEDGTLTCFGNR